jgi:hypothetical protein
MGFLVLMMLFFIVVAFVLQRGARRRAIEAQRAAEEEARRRADAGDAPPPSPFGGTPFGTLFDALLSGTGARSYTIDSVTGEWVEISDRDSMLEDARAAGQGAPEEASERPQPRRDSRRRKQSQSPLGMLMGGGMGGAGGGGEFDVVPPDELTTFADVGGMDAL